MNVLRCTITAVSLLGGYLGNVSLGMPIPNISRSSQLDVSPVNCETNIARLEIAHKDAGQNGLIIMVARLGSGERSRELNRRRLHSARAYLIDYLKVRSLEEIVTAEGERISGYGRIELYVSGKLHTVLAIMPNADLSVGSCEPQELDDPRQRELRKKLYPWRYRK